MAINESKQPIIVKKIVKKGGHHGGAWKIAFADFATAMMAFFMLLWILGSTTEDQKAAISDYFNNPSAFMGVAVSPSQAIGDGTGSKPSLIDFEGAIDMGPLQDPVLDPEQLARLGLQLGADVPVFVRGQAAFAEGVGERLTPVTLSEPWYLVAVPAVSISTAEIFSAPELTRNTPVIKVCGLPEGGGHNDCQPVVEARYPEVRNVLNLLNKFVPARMTGTGACVFGSFPNQSDADKVSRQLPDTLKHFTARGCNVSPLHQKLERLRKEAGA